MLHRDRGKFLTSPGKLIFLCAIAGLFPDLLHAGSVAGHGKRQAEATAILQGPANQPTDANLFRTVEYPDAIPAPPAPPPTDPKTGQPLTAQQLDEQFRDQIRQVMVRRFSRPGATMPTGQAIRQALQVYNDPAILQKVPDARLRASLAMLIGTPGESTIDTVKNSPLVDSAVYSSVPPGFGVGVDPYAWFSPNDQKSALIIHVNQKYQNEDPRLLASVVPHEGIHISQTNLDRLSGNPDQNDNLYDETIAETVGTMVYAQEVSEDPTLAGPKLDKHGRPVIGSNGQPVAQSEAQQRRNQALMDLVNDRVNGQVHILESDYNIVPGGVYPFDSFSALFADNPPIEQDGGPALQGAVDKLAGFHVPNPRADLSTVKVLDQTIGNYFTPEQWVGIMKALKLDLGPFTPPDDENNHHGNHGKFFNQFA